MEAARRGRPGRRKPGGDRDLKQFRVKLAPTIPKSVFIVYQATFAIIIMIMMAVLVCNFK